MRRPCFGPRLFRDRADAGRRLARLLERYRAERPLVLALPRGGVAVAFEAAAALDAPLDVVVARKLGAPGQRELGIGAIAPGGVRVLDGETIRLLRIQAHEIETIAAAATAEMERQVRLYRAGQPPLDAAGRTVLLIDDGLATGVTARAAVHSLRQHKPQRLVLAAPVCAAASAPALRLEVDDLVCVELPADLVAVGRWYINFDQTTDDDVLDLLRRSHRSG